MKHSHSLIVAAIVPFAVLATTPVATTSVGSVPGSGPTQLLEGNGADALAARTSRGRGGSKGAAQRNIRAVRPRSPRQGFLPPETTPPSSNG